MTTTSVSDLRRITEAVEQLRDQVVRDVLFRSDRRQLRMMLEDGRTLLVSVLLDDFGKPRLDVDVLHAPADGIQGQLEVRFDPDP